MAKIACSVRSRKTSMSATPWKAVAVISCAAAIVLRRIDFYFTMRA